MNSVQDAAEKMALRLISRRPEDWTYESALAAVKDFAAVVAVAERERMTVNLIHSCHPECDNLVCVARRKEIVAEREACADICDQHATVEGIAQKCAAAIRARGET